MGNVALEGFGGGSRLNFKIVPGLTQPGSATENTIWVKTEKMTGWIIDVNQPEELEEGMVWISVGVSSAVKFNALKKNGLQVYPLHAKQYVDGALVNVTAVSYQNGEWAEWFTYIIQDGDAGNYGFSTQLRTQCTFPITQESGYINIKGYRDYVSGVLVDTKIDVTKISTIEMDIDAVIIGNIKDAFSAFTGMSLILADNANIASYASAVSSIKAFSNTRMAGRQTIALDVSGMRGQYYVGIALGSCDFVSTGNVNDVASVNLYDIKYFYK